MDYRKLVETIPVPKQEQLSDRLIDFLLSSKNDDKMPSQLANTILHHWQNDILISESGLTALLEAAVLLEPDKTIGAFTELGLTGMAEQIKQSAPKT